jgi:hypothetical protein
MPPDEPQPHPFVQRVAGTQAASRGAPGASLIGLSTTSDRAGKERLYFSAKLDHYAEFDTAAVLDRSPIPPAQSSIPGLDTTRVTLERDSRIDFTYSRTRDPVGDPFDIGVQSGGNEGGGRVPGPILERTMNPSGLPWCPIM